MRATPEPDGGIELTVVVRNTGPRSGHEVVQAYLADPGTGPERPVRWLAGFAVGHALPGAAVVVPVHLSRRSFEVWDVDAHGWVRPAGPYRVDVGRSIRDLRLAVDVDPSHHL